MNTQTFSYITSFILAGCALLTLIVIIPAASASAQQLKPGWRAWVWPLAFAFFVLGSLSAGLSLALDLHNSSGVAWWGGVRDLLLGAALTLIVLNAVYRFLARRSALYFAPFIWLGYLIYVMAIFTLNDHRALAFWLFTGVCALLLIGIYASLYAQERERASDAIPTMIAAVLTTLADVVSSLNFSVHWGWLAFDQAGPAHLVQIAAIFFFLKAASNGYVVKYALHRRQQREHLLVEAKR